MTGPATRPGAPPGAPAPSTAPAGATSGAAPPPPAFSRPRVDEAARLERLARMRRRATGLLLFAAVVFVVTRWFEHAWPWLGYIRAGAEGSLAGGLADWFAVTALFRRPLGLPIPHTAVIPTQKERIGRVLGNFVQSHFLVRDVIATQLRTMRLSEQTARWISDPDNGRRVADRTVAAVARAIMLLPEDEVRALIRESAMDRLRAMKVAPLLGNALALITIEERHQQLFDEILRLVSEALIDGRDAIHDQIRRQRKWWMPVVVDEVIYQRVMAGVEHLIGDLRSNPRHPMRLRLESALLEFIERLKTSPELGARAEALKEQMLSRPMIEEMTASLWDAVRRAAARRGGAGASVSANVGADASASAGASVSATASASAGAEGGEGAGASLTIGERTGSSAPEDALARALRAAGASLLANETLRTELDDLITAVVSSAVEENRHQVAEFISRTVNAWDPDVLAQRLEVAVGSDLQFIRINGTLVGGLAGLGIYVISGFMP